MNPSLSARFAIARLRRTKNVGDISDAIGRSAALEVDGRPDPRPPRRIVWGFDVSRRIISNTVVCVVRQRGRTPRRAVLHVHGGGFTDDFSAGTWTTAARIARATRSEVWSVAYRLAPRQTAETTVREVSLVYQALVETWDATAIACVGDSAGGGLALAAVQDALGRGVAPPGLLILISPWVDLALSDLDTDGAESRDSMLDRGRLEGAARAYAGSLTLSDPRVSPINGALRGLPPVWITAAGDDTLVYQGRRLRSALVEAGVEVHYLEQPGMMHVHALFSIPEGRAALKPIWHQVRSL